MLAILSTNNSRLEIKSIGCCIRSHGYPLAALAVWLVTFGASWARSDEAELPPPRYTGPPASVDGPPSSGLPRSSAPPRLLPSRRSSEIEPRQNSFPMESEPIRPTGEIYPADAVPPLSILLNEPHAPIHQVLADEHFNLDVAKLSPYKSGFFQKLSLSGGWLAKGNDPNDFGMTEIETFAMFALPFPIVEWPLVISPAYNMHLLAGPTGSDLPARLNDAFVEFMWLPTIVHRYTLLISATPGYYSDFQIGDADSFRITGKGLVLFDYIPDRLQLVGGVVYLGRDNLKILPVGGAIWSPTDDFRFELIFPKPKLAARFNKGTGYEDWIYSTAEYGGNTYSIKRTDGSHDKATLQDYRLITGIERKLNGGAGYHVEAGYVFGRRVEYLSHQGDFKPQNTILLRAGITF